MFEDRKKGTATKPKSFLLISLDVLHVICTRLRPGHLSVRVGDSFVEQ